MQQIYEKLQQLQSVLAEKYNIEKRLDELPKQLIYKSEILERIIKGRNEKEALKKTLSSKLSGLRIALAEVQSAKKALEEKMGSIKTQREFEVLEKEINDAGLNEEQHRRESQHLAAELDALQKELDLDNSLIADQEAALEADRNKINDESADEQQRLKALISEESKLSVGLEAGLLAKFETIVRNRSGQGIISIRGGICQGCHMVLPAQFVNQVRAETEINSCPHCSRILFFEEGGNDFTSVFFDHDDDKESLNDYIDDDDLEEEEEPPLVDSEMASDYEDN